MSESESRTFEMLERIKLWQQFRQGEEMLKPRVYKDEDDYVKYHCLRCGHSMIVPKRRGLPRHCYVCGSEHWDDPDYKRVRRLTETQRRHQSILRGMIERCYNPENAGYYNYGGRGIGIDPVWYDHKYRKLNVLEFSKWCDEHGWAPGLQIDRIDTMKGYGPANCRFVTGKENLRNRRTNIYVTVDGKSRCVGEWSEISGIGYHTLLHRIQKKWDPKRAMTIPDGWNRPHLCFHKGINGKGCYREGYRVRCDRSSEAEMRGCPHFCEYHKGDLLPERKRRRRRKHSSYAHFQKVKAADK